MTEIVNIHQAKTHLSRLLERVRRGATITIAKAGEPVAQLVPVGRPPSARHVRESAVLPAGVEVERGRRLRRLLEQEIWPLVPGAASGTALSRTEEDAILGYGPEGV